MAFLNERQRFFGSDALPNDKSMVIGLMKRFHCALYL